MTRGDAKYKKKCRNKPLILLEIINNSVETLVSRNNIFTHLIHIS